MTQHLWYVRKNGEVSGPFPAQQLRQSFSIGELDLRDAVSLDGKHWLTVMESGVLKAEATKRPAESDDDWRHEREKARQRWLDDSVEGRAVPVVDQAEVSDRLRRHEEETRTRLQAESSRRPAFLAGLAFVVVVALIGVGVWLGQAPESGIQASLAGKKRNCDLAPAEGVNWIGCVKDGADLHGSVLKNANLARARLQRANLAAADLAYANLEGANLRGADLRGVSLRGATLTLADLAGADLAGADLGFAVLTGAKLDGARLDGASLRQSTWIDGRLCGDQSVGACQ